jgi:hypothetical protein
MKLIKFLLICSLLTVLAASCNKGLDPIIPVSPKPDVANPELTITYPEEGKSFVSPDSAATITFKMVASDDVELGSVILELNGTQIANITSFMDYRRLDLKYNYPEMLDGDYELKVTVTDLTGKTINKSVNFNKITAPPYTALTDEVAYFSFDGFFLELISKTDPTINGTPGFASGKFNDAYAGATDAYLEYPMTNLLGDEFSLSFWYKINAVPDRAGIMEISPPVPDPTNPNRTVGFRFFRENNGGQQNLGLNIGITSTEIWVNPIVTVPNDQDWMHIAITISTTKITTYVDGQVATETDIASKIDWTGCTSLSIGSGEPNFVYWLHYSDLSLYDELHIFKRELTADEVSTFYQAGR